MKIGRESAKGLRAIQLMAVMNDSMIAREVGLSKQRVGILRRRHGIKCDVEGLHCDPLWPEERVAKLMGLDREKLSLAEASKILGCTEKALNTKQSRLELSKFRDPRIKYTEEFIVSLYQRHKGNISAMAKEVGVPTSGIARECGHYGLKGKGRSEANGGFNYQSERYKYDNEVLTLWKKYDGCQHKIGKYGAVPMGSVHSICLRLGLIK